MFDDVADITSPGHEKDDERQYGDHHGHGSDPAEEPPSSRRTLFDICENVDDKYYDQKYRTDCTGDSHAQGELAQRFYLNTGKNKVKD